MSGRVHLLDKVALVAVAVVASVLVPALASAEPGFSALQPMPRALGVPTHLAGPYTAISCPATNSCTAVASSTDLADIGELTAITETGSSWGAPTQLPLPVNAHVSATLGPYVNDVTCSAVGTCTAVGDYPTSASYGQPLVETETSGAWAPSVIALPVGAKAGSLSSLWCATQGSCITVGYEIPPGSTSKITPVVATETSGAWATATPLLVPLGATSVLPLAIGCTDVDDCVAVGEALSSTTSIGTVYWTESAGTWSGATRFSAPTGYEFLADSVACPVTGTCLVGGELTGPRGLEPAVVTYSGGSWSSPHAISEPKLSPSPQEGEFTAITCSGATMCEAVGLFVSETNELPGAATWTNGTWSSVGLLDGLGVKGVPAKGGLLLGVSCASSTSCVAIGLDVAVKEVAGSESIVGEGDFSAALTPVRTVTKPAAPASIDAIAIVRGVDVQWTPPTNDGGSPVVNYTATLAPGGRHCATTQQQCRISGLTNGRRYEVTVRDVTSFGLSAPASASFVAGSAPQSPRDVRATVHNQRISVIWHRSTAPAPEHVTAYVVTAWRGKVLLETCRTKQLKCTFREFRAGNYVLELTATDATGTSLPTTVHVRIP